MVINPINKRKHSRHMVRGCYYLFEVRVARRAACDTIGGIGFRIVWNPNVSS